MSSIRLTPEDRLEIDEGTTHGEYAESLITAQLLKATDVLDKRFEGSKMIWWQHIGHALREAAEEGKES